MAARNATVDEADEAVGELGQEALAGRTEAVGELGREALEDSDRDRRRARTGAVAKPE